MPATDYIDFEPADDEPQEVTCERCGEDGLSWHHTGVRWILIDAKARPHVCRPNADDFDVVGG